MKQINWTELYQTQGPLLKGICRRYVKNFVVAEDMVHNAFEIAINKIDSYEGRGSFNGWLKRIAINECLQYLRDEQQKLQKGLDYERSVLAEMKMDEMKEPEKQNIYTKEELIEIVDSLPEQHKLVFNLYVLDGYKHHEIAQMLNISTGTSKSHLSRARKKAQTLLVEKKEAKKHHIYRKSWVLLLLLRFNLIDSIFKSQLTTYSVAIQNTPILVSIANNTSIKAVSLLASKIAIWSIASSMTVGSVVFLCKNQIESDQAQNCVHEIIALPKLEIREDYLTHSNITDKLMPIPAKPVLIIKKQRIVRDTVYVQKAN